MKKITAFILCFIMIGAAAMSNEHFFAKNDGKEMLSIAFQIISGREPMAKSVVGDETIAFTARDFTLSIGASVDFVTITSLPAYSTGCLFLGDLNVSEGQRINMSSIDQLRFVANKGVKEASFCFSADDGVYEKECRLFFLDGSNYSPVSLGCDESFFSLCTYKNVTIGGRMVADDPENDEVRFEIVSYPKNGLLKVLDRYSGDYEYTPVKNFTGDDSFKYRAVDKYGNRSAVISVSIDVKRSRQGVIFKDMVYSPLHYGAILMTDKGIMTAYESADGMVFMPDIEVSKGEFITYAMKALNIEPNYSYKDVVMANIPTEYRPYINAADQKGAIYSNIEDFDHSVGISRSEACYILSALMDAGIMKTEAVFADGDKIPEYAYNSVQAMAQMNIVPVENGKAEPQKLITRAECARILSAIISRG